MRKRGERVAAGMTNRRLQNGKRDGGGEANATVGEQRGWVRRSGVTDAAELLFIPDRVRIPSARRTATTGEEHKRAQMRR